MLILEIDRARLDAHLAAVVAEAPGLIPVVKGNGYGFGLNRLAGEAVKLGANTLAVGTLAEASRLPGTAEAFERIIVLTPHLPGDRLDALPPGLAGRIVHTVATRAAAEELGGRRLVVECRTSLRRHGIGPDDLAELARTLAETTCEGFALHLPMARPTGADPVGEVAAWTERLAAAGLPTATVFVSHVTGAEVADLSARFPGTSFRPRIGTRLWLGDRGALQAKARVLDVERLTRGERYGYRQRRAPRAGHLVVAAGGTAHGIGLAAPKAVAGPLARAKVAAEGSLATLNRTLSPFSWDGRQRWFAEPPHMQVSLLWMPESVTPPAVGDWLDVETRMTTTTFDEVVER